MRSRKWTDISSWFSSLVNCGSASKRQSLVFIGVVGAAYPNCADDLAVGHNRHPALQRREVVQRDHGGAAFRDDVFKELGWMLKQSRGPRLAHGNVGSCREGSVDTFQRDQVAAVINDGDDSAR